MLSDADVLPAEALLPAATTAREWFTLMQRAGFQLSDWMVDRYGRDKAVEVAVFRSLLDRRADSMLASVDCPAGCGVDLEFAFQGFADPVAGVDTAFGQVMKVAEAGLLEHFNGVPVPDLVFEYAQWLDSVPWCGSGLCPWKSALLAVSESMLQELCAASWRSQVECFVEAQLAEGAAWTMDAAAAFDDVDPDDLAVAIASSPDWAEWATPEALQGCGWGDAASGFGALDVESFADDLGLPQRLVARCVLSVVTWLYDPWSGC